MLTAVPLDSVGRHTQSATACLTQLVMPQGFPPTFPCCLDSHIAHIREGASARFQKIVTAHTEYVDVYMSVNLSTIHAAPLLPQSTVKQDSHKHLILVWASPD